MLSMSAMFTALVALASPSPSSSSDSCFGLKCGVDRHLNFVKFELWTRYSSELKTSQI